MHYYTPSPLRMMLESFHGRFLPLKHALSNVVLQGLGACLPALSVLYIAFLVLRVCLLILVLESVSLLAARDPLSVSHVLHQMGSASCIFCCVGQCLWHARYRDRGRRASKTTKSRFHKPHLLGRLYTRVFPIVQR